LEDLHRVSEDAYPTYYSASQSRGAFCRFPVIDSKRDGTRFVNEWRLLRTIGRRVVFTSSTT
jgi:hypothetical protein